MGVESNRRNFLFAGTGLAAGLLAGGAFGQEKKDDPHAGHGEQRVLSDRGKLTPGRRRASDPPVPVETPDVPTLKWEMKDGVKEFQLHVQHLKREFLPGMRFDVWGFNGSMPGPMIEVVEGDKVRIVVHNELPEPTTMHWHGLEVPIAMDGVAGVTQDPIMPGKTFTYEFQLHQNGTFFYHVHAAMQERVLALLPQSLADQIRAGIRESTLRENAEKLRERSAIETASNVDKVIHAAASGQTTSDANG